MRFGGLRVLALALGVLCSVARVSHAQEELKIGGIGPLSGGGTAWGLALNRGVQMAVAEVNAAAA